MTKPVILEYCALNVAATPHPPGVYDKIFREAAGNSVRFYGDHFAAISKPTSRGDGFFQGRVVIWTQIDPTEPAVDKTRLAEIDLADIDFHLPENIGFNTRSFFYVFREKDHTLFVEQKNELGKRLSASRARRIFAMLFDAPILGADAPLVEITIVPSEDALERILGMARLKRLKIHIVRPNADDEDVQAILDELEMQGAKSQDVLLVASQTGDGITPNERTRKQAEVAQYNGHVEGAGRDEDNKPAEGSTKQYPRIISRSLDEIGTAVTGILGIAKETIIRKSGR